MWLMLSSGCGDGQSCIEQRPEQSKASGLYNCLLFLLAYAVVWFYVTFLFIFVTQSDLGKKAALIVKLFLL